MNKVQFTVFPVEQIRGHQVRILVDGQDLIAYINTESLGRDPAGFLAENVLLPSKISQQCIIAICGCGCIGCSDITASIRMDNDCIVWENFSLPIMWNLGDTLIFDRLQYQEEISRSKNDYSWETIERTAGRKKNTRLKF